MKKEKRVGGRGIAEKGRWGGRGRRARNGKDGQEEKEKDCIV